MISFFLKKNFCDGWDNLFFIVASNLFPIIVVVAGFFGIRYAANKPFVIQALSIILFTGILMMVVFAFGANAAKIANFDTPSFGAFFRCFSYSWKVGLLFGIMISTGLLIAKLGILYYLNMFGASQNIIWFLPAALLCWFVIVCAIAFQWFIPLYFLQETNNFSKCFKKSFIIFFDNPLFSIGMFIHNVLLFTLSLCFVLLLPGFSGITISSMNALRLRLYKYDWIEEHPEIANSRVKRSKVPWDELLADDKESLGPRKISSFLFPWR